MGFFDGHIAVESDLGTADAVGAACAYAGMMKYVVDLNLPSGVLWSKTNADSFEPESEGCLYPLNTWLAIDGNKGIFGVGMRMPTHEEFEELVSNTEHKFVYGETGRVVGVVIQELGHDGVFDDAFPHIYLPISPDRGSGLYWTSSVSPNGKGSAEIINNYKRIYSAVMPAGCEGMVRPVCKLEY